MPIKSNNFTSKTKQFVNRLQGRIGEEVMTEILVTGLSYADAITPRDTSNLVNSRYKKVYPFKSRIVGVAGYATKYAPWVHKMPMKLKGKPRADFGTTRAGVSFGGGTGKGNYWDPDAENFWLEKGFNRDGKAEIEQIIKERHKVKNIID